MDKHHLSHAMVTALGFLLGAGIAMAIVPGDNLVLLATGVVFGYFTRTLFDQEFGDESPWPLGGPAGRKTLAATPRPNSR
jgi:hypothetical protein